MYKWNTGRYGLDSFIYLLTVTWISDSIRWTFALSFLLSSMTRSLAGRDSPNLTIKRRTKANAKYRYILLLLQYYSYWKREEKINLGWKKISDILTLAQLVTNVQFFLFSLRLPPSPTFSCLIFEDCCLTKKNSLKIQKGCTVLSYLSSSSFKLFLLSSIYSWLPKPEFSEIPWLFLSKYCFFPDHFMTCGNGVIVLRYLLSIFSSLNGSLQHINLNYMSNIF